MAAEVEWQFNVRGIDCVVLNMIVYLIFILLQMFA